MQIHRLKIKCCGWSPGLKRLLCGYSSRNERFLVRKRWGTFGRNDAVCNDKMMSRGFKRLLRTRLAMEMRFL